MVKRNKPLLTVSVSPYLKEQANELVSSGKFGSMSDLVSIALAEFIGKYKKETTIPRESLYVESCQVLFDKWMQSTIKTHEGRTLIMSIDDSDDSVETTNK